MMKQIYILFFSICTFINAQEIKVIDQKGTLNTVRNNQVTTGTTAPTTPLENDIWFDNSNTNNVITKIYDGTTWKDISTGTAWNTLGNSGTSTATNFLGTTDAQSLVVRTNNIEAARFTNETTGINSRFLLTPANTWTGISGSSNVIGINTASNNQRLRITSGSSDTQDDSQGASIDLFGNSTMANEGRLDLVGGSSASGLNNAITFWGNDGGFPSSVQAQRMVINGQGNVGIGNTTPNENAVLDLTNSDDRALLLPSEAQPTDIPSAVDGMIVYASDRNNAYLQADNAWKPIAYNAVTNELIFNGDDDAVTTNDDYYYVSFVVNGDWKVIRYDKRNVNVEDEASITNNSGVTSQPTTLAACTSLSF